MKPTNVDQYIASLPAEQSAIVAELRAIVKKAAPGATDPLNGHSPFMSRTDR